MMLLILVLHRNQCLPDTDIFSPVYVLNMAFELFNSTLSRNLLYVSSFNTVLVAPVSLNLCGPPRTGHACNWTVRVILGALLRCTLLSKLLGFQFSVFSIDGLFVSRILSQFY